LSGLRFSWSIWTGCHALLGFSYNSQLGKLRTDAMEQAATSPNSVYSPTPSTTDPQMTTTGKDAGRWEVAKEGWRKSAVEHATKQAKTNGPAVEEDRPRQENEEARCKATEVMEVSKDAKTDHLEEDIEAGEVQEGYAQKEVTEVLQGGQNWSNHDGLSKKVTKAVAFVELDTDTDEEAKIGPALEKIRGTKEVKELSFVHAILHALQSNSFVFALLTFCCITIFVQSSQFRSAQDIWHSSEEYQRQEKIRLEKQVHRKEQELQDQLLRSREDLQQVLQEKKRVGKQLADSKQIQMRLKDRLGAAETRAVELQEKVDGQEQRWENGRSELAKKKADVRHLGAQLDKNSKILKQDAAKEDHFVENMQSELKAHGAQKTALKKELDQLRLKQQKELSDVHHKARNAETELHRARSESSKLQSQVMQEEAELKEERMTRAAVQDELGQERSKYKASENLRNEDAAYVKNLENRIAALTNKVQFYNHTAAENKEQALQIRMDAALIEKLQSKLNAMKRTEEEVRKAKSTLPSIQAAKALLEIQHLRSRATRADIGSHGSDADSDEKDSDREAEDGDEDDEENW